MALDPADETAVQALCNTYCDRVSTFVTAKVAADASAAAAALSDMKLDLFTVVQQALELNRLTQGPQ